MSICRFSESCDVYVFYNVHGGIDCCGCVLTEGADFKAQNEQAMIAHLEKHVAAGHKVPAGAFEELAQPSEL
jgi:hypothetical protein